MSKIHDCVKSKPDSFYFRPARNGSFHYEKSPVGVNTLNKILPEKLCAKAGIGRKTSHCLRITLASRLFQNAVPEKQIRERTGHTSSSLFCYEKPSENQMQFVSSILAPKDEVCDSFLPEKSDELPSNLDIPLESNTPPKSSSDTFEFPSFELSDELLANLDIPESNTPASNELPASSNNFEYPSFEISDEFLSNLDISELTAASSASSSSSSSIAPVFNNCVFNCYKL